MTKNELRKKILCKRKQMNVEYKNLCDRIIFQRLFAFLKKKHFNNVFIYFSLEHEVDTKKAISHFLQQNKNIYLPKVIDCNNMIAIKIDKSTEYKMNALRIYEPINGISISPEKLDLCIIPIVGFDEHCNRLGFGKGFYDRFLHHTKVSSIKIGLAYEVQKYTNIPIEQHDFPLDCIITEKKIYLPD